MTTINAPSKRDDHFDLKFKEYGLFWFFSIMIGSLTIRGGVEIFSLWILDHILNDMINTNIKFGTKLIYSSKPIISTSTLFPAYSLE